MRIIKTHKSKKDVTHTVYKLHQLDWLEYISIGLCLWFVFYPTPYEYLLLALFSAVCMASSGIIARYSQLSAAELTFCRLAVGALCLGLFLLLSGKGRQLKRKPDLIVVINGILLASFMLGFLQAIQSISLANAIMLVYLAPPLTAVIAHFFYGEKLTLLSLLFIALSVLGFAMLQQFQLDP